MDTKFDEKLRRKLAAARRRRRRDGDFLHFAELLAGDDGLNDLVISLALYRRGELRLRRTTVARYRMILQVSRMLRSENDGPDWWKPHVSAAQWLTVMHNADLRRKATRRGTKKRLRALDTSVAAFGGYLRSQWRSSEPLPLPR